MTRTRSTLLAALAGALGLTIGAAVFALAAPSSTEITACVSKSSGAMRLRTPALPCKSTENPVSWNREGAPGADGVSGYEVVKVEDEFTAQGLLGAVSESVPCPTGKVVVGGGGFASFLPAGEQFFTRADLTVSLPSADGTFWEVDFQTRDGSPFDAGDKIVWTAHAACINAVD